ncbi:unnamed protein product, partial [marine sediment metagenome]
ITYKSREHYEAEIAEWKDDNKLVFLKKNRIICLDQNLFISSGILQKDVIYIANIAILTLYF